MSCKKCNENIESFTTEYHYYESFPLIVNEGKNFLKNYNTETGIIECASCGALWIIESKDIYYDPRDRSGQPALYEVKSRVLTSEETYLIKNPSILNLLELDKKIYPYGFFNDYLESFPKNLKKELNKIHENKNVCLSVELKGAISYWYEKNNSNRIMKKWLRQNPKSKVLLKLENEVQLLAIKTLDNEKLLLVFQKNMEYLFHAVSSQNGIKLWEVKVPRFRPWMKLIYPIKIINNRIISLHLSEDENGPFIYRPHYILITDFDGQLIYEQALEWYFYEKSTLEKDSFSVSQVRIIHNFNLTVIDNNLFFAHKNFLIVVDLETGKIISQVEFSKNELFTGNIRVRNDGLYLAELLHGWVLLNKNFRLLEDSYYLSKSFTVLSLSNGMTLYQNGLLLLPETGLKLELGEVKAHPLTNGKTVFVPLDDHMLIISEKGRILSKINFKAEDSFDAVRSDLKIKGFLSGDYYITFSEDDKIIISDINGKNHTWIKIDGYPVSLGSIDSERFYVFYFISNSIDESRYYLEIYNYHLEKIHKQIVLNPDFFAFSPDGYFYIYERFIFEKNNGLIRSYHYPISFSSVNT